MLFRRFIAAALAAVCLFVLAKFLPLQPWVLALGIFLAASPLLIRLVPVSFVAAAFLIVLGLSQAFAQSTADLANAACSDTARPYLVWALGVIGVANIIAWSKRVMAALPAPLQVAIHFAAGNWRTLAVMAGKVAPVIIIAVLVASCTKQEAANLQTGSQALVTGAQAVQQTVVTLQPVASDLACAAQSGANLTATVAEETHNTDVAKGAGTASTVAGTFCNGLAAGAPLPAPVPVTGQTMTVNGVTLPVPVAATTPAN